jgi:hypothetical protein
MVIVPPYCGVPRLSHQLPLVAVVVFTGVVVDVDTAAVVVVVVVCVVVVALVVVCVVAAVVVEELQDAKTKDVAIRKVSNIQIAPLFIWTS